MKQIRTVLLVSLAIGLAALAWWLAETEDENYQVIQPGRINQDNHGNKLPPGLLRLDEIMQRLQLPQNSRILDVEIEMKNGKLYYEIELLMPGDEVRELYVDPYTGAAID